jgi:hypothetical protein
VAVPHVTPLKLLAIVPAGAGVIVIDQPPPFHTSIRRRTDDPETASPAARQRVAVGHEMLVRLAPVAPPGFGLVIIDQLDPFQRSTSVPRPEPTAKQLVALRHVTPVSSVCATFAGFGLATIDHFVPFQRSTSVLVATSVV